MTGTSDSEITLWTEAPDWVAISDRLAKLSACEKEIIDESNAIHAALDRRRQAMQVSDPRVPGRIVRPPVQKTISKAARLLLGEFAPAPPPPPPTTDEAKPVVEYDDPAVARLHELAADLANVREATGELLPRLTVAHLAGSAQLCKALEPEYDTLAKRVCDAMVELASATLAHDSFMQYHASAALGYLRPIVTDMALGDAREHGARLRRALTFAAETGHFDLATLPAELKQPATPRPAASRPVTPSQSVVRAALRSVLRQK